MPDPLTALWLPTAVIVAGSTGQPRPARLGVAAVGGAAAGIGLWAGGWSAAVGAAAGVAAGAGAALISMTTLGRRGWPVRLDTFPGLLLAATGAACAAAVLVLLPVRTTEPLSIALWFLIVGSLAAVLPWLLSAATLVQQRSPSGVATAAGMVIGAMVLLGLIAVTGPRAAPSLAFATLAVTALREAAAVRAVAAAAALLGLYPLTAIHSGATPDPFLLLFAAVAITLGNGSRTAASRLRRVAHDAAKEASTDPLTGLLNRRGLDRALTPLIASSEARGVPLFMMVIDLDGLKPLNDRSGHAAGDAALKQLADSIRACVRHGDAVARVGGDEFALALSGSSAERMRAIDASIRAHFTPSSAATYSAGAVQYRSGDTAHELMAQADAAMYVAKRAGGARTVWADADTARNPVEKMAAAAYQDEGRTRAASSGVT